MHFTTFFNISHQYLKDLNAFSTLLHNTGFISSEVFMTKVTQKYHFQQSNINVLLPLLGLIMSGCNIKHNSHTAVSLILKMTLHLCHFVCVAG